MGGIIAVIGKEVSAEELLERYAAGERDFSGLRVYSWRKNLFQEVDLSGINLEGAHLHVDLSGSIMRNSNFRYSVWGGRCRWKQIDFTKSDFTGINNGVPCHFTRCNFSHTIWTDADLWQSTFEDCIDDQANFSEASFIEVRFE